MQPAGYSGKSLAEKLGVKAGDRVDLLAGPADYEDWVPGGVIVRDAVETEARFVHLFVEWRGDLERAVSGLLPRLDKRGVLWISWPKKASRAPTDLDEQILRDVCLPTGLVDVKVCAINEKWSGLKFVWRKELR